MRFENIQVFNFEHALRGMRNPKDSWSKSDSFFGLSSEENARKKVKQIAELWSAGVGKKTLEEYKNWLIDNGVLSASKLLEGGEYAFIGPQDMRLAQTLIKAGSEHRKFLRQIFVTVDITAPLFWYKEFDTYKVGTVANSTSTMHTLMNKEITKDCFEIDDLNKEVGKEFMHLIIDQLESWRFKFQETKDNKYWKEIIRWLPSSWLQKRTVTMNYENLLGMCSRGQRRFHKLNEWSGKDNPEKENFISFARKLPYAKEFIFIDEQP